MSELTAFVRDGFVVVPEVVSAPLLAQVDEEFARVMEQQPPGTEGAPHHSAFVPPATVPACTTAFDHSPARELAESLVEPRLLDHRFDHVQLCTVPPGRIHRPGSPHIDGMGHDPERPETFTMLAGIYLDDETQPERGNVYMWPGSHRLHAEVHREHGIDALLKFGGHVGMLQPDRDLGVSHPVYASRGDLLLAHYLTGHNSGGNLGDRTRRIVYFRLAAAGHTERWETTMTDPWHEYSILIREIDTRMNHFRPTSGFGDGPPIPPSSPRE